MATGRRIVVVHIRLLLQLLLAVAPIPPRQKLLLLLHLVLVAGRRGDAAAEAVLPPAGPRGRERAECVVLILVGAGAGRQG